MRRDELIAAMGAARRTQVRREATDRAADAVTRAAVALLAGERRDAADAAIEASYWREVIAEMTIDGDYIDPTDGTRMVEVERRIAELATRFRA